MFRLLLSLVLSCMVSAPLFAATGSRQITIDAPGFRPLQVAIWYPVNKAGIVETLGENPAFTGIPVQRDAEPEAGEHPLVLLSHGYGGNWRNLNWLAADLVAKGFIVAAPDHPGTTTKNMDPIAARQLWLRPRDLTQVMDILIARPSLAGKIDTSRIAAVGHSLGGWTVMALAGARFDAEKFTADCRQHPGLADCKLTTILGINYPGVTEKLRGNLGDTRLKAVVSLDLGMARGFSDSSLAKLKIPVLVLGAQFDLAGLPAAMESTYLAKRLPSSSRNAIIIAGSTHFSFMQLCKPGAAALINAQAPGEGIICRDGDARGRDVIHRDIAQRVMVFLSRALDYPLALGDSR